ncbi:MAG TPA: MerR family DNA-binding protein [Sphingomicrobium sp.]|jgi:MerR family mercuric resistance operon transcriptional regulator|nr:MerR family DNA-binding protein [Sphingomicrobium sp.]
MGQTYSIGAFAKAGGVGVETVRYYERRKLLNQPQRGRGSIRRYGEAELSRLRFIRRAQAAGFSLDEVAALIQIQRKSSCIEARAMASAKLREVEDRLAALRRLREDLKEWVAQCDGNEDKNFCPVLDDLLKI